VRRDISHINSIEMKKPQHIAIVGAGLVGSLLSIYLAKRGYRVSVFERRFDLRQHQVDGGRSINMALSARGIRALEEVGLADQLKTSAVPMNGRMMHDIAGHTTFQRYGKEGQYINSISRSGLNMVLMTEAEKHGVEFFFGHRVTGVDFEKTEIAIQIHAGFVHKAFDLIIGADGNFSAIRGSMQLTDRFEYSQTYIEHGYKEFRIPPDSHGNYQMEKNALHIWPRESYMLIALPNPDSTFTCTLFFPFEGDPSLKSLKKPKAFQSFFEKAFPDATPLMPTLMEDLRDNPTSSLITIRCYPWAVNHTLIIGDASHGIVPFFGQGMNSGFEDCRILNQMLDTHEDNWKKVLPKFQASRKPHTDAIAKLAMDNFVEMRDLVADENFLLRKKIEARIHELYPDRWIPLYSMVTFHDNIGYAEADAIGEKQRRIMDEVMTSPDIASTWQSLNFQQLVLQLES
jgi:kynurenine 3-monooxygenase